jgi:signal transduction histidine kinase
MVVDATVGCLMVAGSVVGELKGADHRGDGTIEGHDVAAMVVALLAVTLRRRWPQPILVATAVATSVLMVVAGGPLSVLIGAIGFVAYTAASRTDRRTAWITAGVVAVGLYVVAALVVSGSLWSPDSFGAIAWIGMTTAIGDAARTGRAYVAEVEERARRAEQTREEEASQRVIQERVRIARELHDVVAHHIAVINVQAGAAGHVLKQHPEQAEVALSHIRDACDTVLGELASIVGVLRQPEDDTAIEPVRGLASLTDMVDTLAAAGLTVERTRHGEPRELPAVVDLAAYRILQEALTNAHKYGTGRATLTITYTAEGIVLEVVNAVAADRAPATSGYGIVGMRERAASAGGTVHAQAGPGGRFTVRAELPALATKP